MALLSSIILLPVNLESNTGSDMETAFQDIKSFLMVIILNIFLVLQMINVSAVAQIFSEMKESNGQKTESNQSLMNNIGMPVVEEDASSLDLLRSEERPTTPE